MLEPGAPRARFQLLTPLGLRDFRLMWAGLTVSLFGDGIYLVAVAWQAYELSSSPTALSGVGLAQSLPLVLFLLLGGVLSDRVDRRRMMIASDLLRAGAIATVGTLSLTGDLTLPLLVALVAVYGFGQALFYPAFGAIVPEIVPPELLVQANSLDQFVRPFALGMAGPAIGGFAIQAFEVGGAFVIDALTFCFSVMCLLFMRYRRQTAGLSSWRRAWGEVGEGFRFVREHAWLWATLAAAALSLLVFVGPFEVLLPHVLKFELGRGSSDLGLVFAAGGLGSIAAAAVIGQRGLPRRFVTFMYSAWFVAVVSVAGFGFMQSVPQGMAFRFLGASGAAAGAVVWATMMHRLVPSSILGRVTSLDYLVSFSLIPLSFAVTGPVASIIGTRTTLVWAGVLGGFFTLTFLFVTGVRNPERTGELAGEEPA
jgi:hypothetical protein